MSEAQDSDGVELSLPELPDTDDVHSLLYPKSADFWEQCRPWLAERGVMLYELRMMRVGPWHHCHWWLSPTNTSETRNLPYSVCTGKHDGVSPIMNTAGWSRIACAQDAMHRDLAIKIIITGSMEHQIYQRIHELPAELFADSSTFPCILPPVLILDSQRGYAFVVMPMQAPLARPQLWIHYLCSALRWGCPIYVEDIQTVGGAMSFMRCYLQGMASLHQLRIAYRDVWDYNTVINRHTPYETNSEAHRGSLRDHRGDSDVLYALMDFDQSAIFPMDTVLEECLLPSTESVYGAAMYKPLDVHFAPRYYNPFPFDVGAAGFLFRRYFQNVVPFIPGLAPLFDRMTDRFIQRRFSAAEALLFFRGLEEQTPPDTLDAAVALAPDFDPMEDADVYWSKLSPDQIRLWGTYRTPPQPCWATFLDRMLDFRKVKAVLRFVRGILRV